MKDTEANRQTDRDIDRQIDKDIHRQADRHRQTGRATCRDRITGVCR